ncbi:uncharacterized protein EI90DRAFT_3075815 [Cantharellus anzutake]|uniref:uncharacterized protein n=1 Tax=Cantharellus anzutake TaxID=1750568 RepID=UPI001905A4B8|nr:uncharacterized protein EI90DRAFT_3075815 [Cantharellus anzutake]KAF8324309.1 hypothetical protein EI90DRAFT_3075815 [Cantharellus anzutake]
MKPMWPTFSPRVQWNSHIRRGPTNPNYPQAFTGCRLRTMGLCMSIRGLDDNDMPLSQPIDIFVPGGGRFEQEPKGNNGPCRIIQRHLRRVLSRRHPKPEPQPADRSPSGRVPFPQPITEQSAHERGRYQSLATFLVHRPGSGPRGRYKTL